MLDALGDNGGTDPVRECDNDLDQMLELRVEPDVLHEAGIKLQDIDREMLEISERRMPYAEVVDRDQHAGVAQFTQHTRRGLDIAHGRALGDLEHDTPWR